MVRPVFWNLKCGHYPGVRRPTSRNAKICLLHICRMYRVTGSCECCCHPFGGVLSSLLSQWRHKACTYGRRKWFVLNHTWHMAWLSVGGVSPTYHAFQWEGELTHSIPVCHCFRKRGPRADWNQILFQSIQIRNCLFGRSERGPKCSGNVT
jgi:hypothetical protein